MDVRHEDKPTPTSVSDGARDASVLWAWLLAAPGLFILACGAIALTPAIIITGCRLGGFLQLSCNSDVVKPAMEVVFGIAILSLVYWEAAAPVVAVAIAIVAWRLWRRWRAR